MEAGRYGSHIAVESWRAGEKFTQKEIGTAWGRRFGDARSQARSMKKRPDGMGRGRNFEYRFSSDVYIMFLLRPTVRWGRG
jgi:hypothetical protein